MTFRLLRQRLQRDEIAGVLDRAISFAEKTGPCKERELERFLERTARASMSERAKLVRAWLVTERMERLRRWRAARGATA